MNIKPEKLSDAVTLYEGDCLDVLPTLTGVDAVVTDPPYGINANHMTLGAGKKNFKRGDGWDIERPDISPLLAIAPYVCIWGGNYFADFLPPSNDWLIWHKVNDGRSFSECEMAWTNFGRQTRHLSHHWAGEVKQHPTQKPLMVMQWCLRQLPDEVKTILDCYAGSGTTGVAAAIEQKKCILIEKDPHYCDIIRRRIADAEATGPQSLFKNAKHPELFAEVAV